VNFVVCQGFGFEFITKAKPLGQGHSPKAMATKYGLKAKD